MTTKTVRNSCARVLAAIFSAAWALPQPILEEMIAIADRQLSDLEAVAAKQAAPLVGTRGGVLRDGVAILAIDGPIFRYANLFTELSGATSLEQLALDFQAAIDNPQVKAILLNVDSPGGEVTGIHEMAAMIQDLKKKKPVQCYAGGTCASAAYWLASATDRIVANATAVLGSIGVVSTWTDRSKAREAQGVRTIEFVSSQSPNKRPDPNTDGGRAQIQALVDRVAEEMIGQIAAFRGKTPQQVVDDFGAGGVKVGKDAVAAGMADAIGTFEATLAELAAAGRSFVPKPGAAASAIEVKPMDIDTMRKDHAAVAGQLIEEGRQAGHKAGLLEGTAAGRVAGITDERKRVADIRARLGGLVASGTLDAAAGFEIGDALIAAGLEGEALASRLVDELAKRNKQAATLGGKTDKDPADKPKLSADVYAREALAIQAVEEKKTGRPYSIAVAMARVQNGERAAA
jgi:signal peptide peptidase SppA